MPITVVHGPDPRLLGQAANQAGFGQFQQARDQFQEGQHQFDQTLGFRYAGLGEQARQFDTTFGEGQRQFDTSQDLRERQFGEASRQFDTTFGEGQRQFDLQQALRDEQFQEQQHQFDLGYGLDLDKLEQQQSQFDASLDFQGQQLDQQAFEFNKKQQQNEWLARYGQQSDIAKLGIQGQINSQLQKDRFLQQIAQDRFGQNAQDARQQQTIQSQMQARQMELVMSQANSEWMALSKILPQLPQEEQGRLIQEFNAKWSAIKDLPMPIEFPEVPIPQDPRIEQQQREFQIKEAEAAAKLEDRTTRQQQRQEDVDFREGQWLQGIGDKRAKLEQDSLETQARAEQARAMQEMTAARNKAEYEMKAMEAARKFAERESMMPQTDEISGKVTMVPDPSKNFADIYQRRYSEIVGGGSGGGAGSGSATAEEPVKNDRGDWIIEDESRIGDVPDNETFIFRGVRFRMTAVYEAGRPGKLTARKPVRID